MSGELTQEIRAIVAQHAKLNVAVDALGDDDDLFAAGMTSLNSVNLMLALEERFDVEFPNELLNRTTFGSVASIAQALAGLGAVAA